MRHGVLTFVLKIDPARRERLERLLADADADGRALGLCAVDTLHHAAIMLLDRPLLDSLFVLECNFDGPVETFVPTLLALCPDMGAMLACLRPPAGVAAGDAAAMLLGAVVRPAARHVGATGLGVEEIRRSAVLAGEMRDFIDALPPDATSRRAEVIASLLQTRFLAEAPAAKPRLGTGERIARWLGLLTDGVLSAIAAALVTLLRQLTGRAAAEPVREDWRAPRAQPDVGEDRPGYAGNHFCSATPLKIGAGRWLSRIFFMRLLDNLAQAYYTKGKLGDIPSIHFAHWAVLDEGSTLLFVSNYDGSWGSYLDDFIEKATKGLTGVWGHAQGFPRSRWLVLGGASDGDAFKRYARDSQVVPRLWFSAYPELTVGRINDNRAILEGLWGQGEPPAIWLKRL